MSLIDQIKKLADDDVKFTLAVSLHSAIDEIRSRIMPFSANFPLADLRESLEYWYRKTKSKKHHCSARHAKHDRLHIIGQWNLHRLSSIFKKNRRSNS